MSTPILGVRYTRTFNDPVWRALGRPPLLADRDLLVLGEYVPGVGTAGVIEGIPLTDVEANSSGIISLSVPDTVHRNKMFWGEVQCTAPGQEFENCWVAGRDPDLITAATTNCVKSYGASIYHSTWTDCTIDPSPWQTQRGKQIKATLGFQGGNFTFRRGEIKNVEDCVSHLGHDVMAGEASTYTHETIIEQSWLHKTFYDNGDHVARSDKRLHSDVIQLQTGKNITIRGNMLGGARDITGYRTWPNGYNSGDDGWNAAIQIAQAVSTDAPAQIENVLIEQNFIAGGTSGINHGYQTVRPNTFATTVIKDNKFFARGTGCGTSANGPGTYDTGNGYYVIRSTSLASTYTGNTIYETGAAVPISNG